VRLYLVSALFLLNASATAACPALLDRSMDTILEQPQSLCEYTGKVLLLVNTASQCGYTPQYESLEARCTASTKRVAWWSSGVRGALESDRNSAALELSQVPGRPKRQQDHELRYQDRAERSEARRRDRAAA